HRCVDGGANVETEGGVGGLDGDGEDHSGAPLRTVHNASVHVSDHRRVPLGGRRLERHMAAPDGPPYLLARQSPEPPKPSPEAQSAIWRCFGNLDRAVYLGFPLS